MHKTLSSVYAWQDELEAWRLRRQEPRRSPDGEVESGPAKRTRLRRSLWIAAIAAPAILIAALLLRPQQPAPIPFQQRDWVLIAAFENRTGEALFDGTVEYALERELTSSQFVNVVPRERVNDALELMRRPIDSRIEVSIAREICLRDGGIRALISGRVESIGGTYVIGAELVDPVSGSALRSISERSAGHEGVVAAISRLSHGVRRMLGEELSAASADEGRRMERVSTPSLRALQIYSQADTLFHEHKLEEATALLREAVREDPTFASAHVLLAHALANSGQREEAAPHFQRAFELADTTSDRERLFITAGHYQRFEPNEQKAIEALETLTRLYPDHYWATSNLMVAYSSQNRLDDALPLTVRRADLRPNSLDHQLRAAQALAVGGRFEQAETYAERARRVIAAERDDPRKPWRAAWLRLYPVHAQWLRGAWSEALQEADSIAATVEALPPDAQTPLHWELGSFHLVMGRQQEATRFFSRMRGFPDNAALAALAAGDVASMKRHLQVAPASHRTAILLARAGLIDEAVRALEHPQIARRAYAPFLPHVWETLARGEIAFAAGRHGEAIARLDSAERMLRGWPTPFYFLGVDALSRALEREGQLGRSLAVLEDAALHGRSSIFWGPAPLFWMQNEIRRAELHRRNGREDVARRTETAVRDLLVVAEAGFEPDPNR